MKNERNQNTANSWLNVPIIVTIARLLCRELTLQNEYLRQENKILKSKIKKRIVFTEDERRTLIDAALTMGRDLMEQVVTIVKPKTILAWQLKLENEKWDYLRLSSYNGTTATSPPNHLQQIRNYCL